MTLINLHRIPPVFTRLAYVVATVMLFGLTSCSSSNHSVGQPSFTLSATAATVTLIAGAPGISLSLVATAQNGFTAPVQVSLTGLPTGVTVQPAAITLVPGTATQVTFSASSTTAVASTPATITATSGTLMQTSVLTINVSAAPTVSLTTSTPSISLVAGGASTSVSLLATGQNGFTAPVQVSFTGLPAGVTVQPVSITLTPGTATQVTFSASSAAAVASTTVTITASSSTLTQTVALTVNVTAAPTFSLTIGSPSIRLIAGGASASISLLATGQNGFNSPLSVALTGLPAGVSVQPSIITLTPGTPSVVSLSAPVATQAASSLATFTATSGSLTQTTNLSVSVDTAPTFTLSVNPPSVNLIDSSSAVSVSLLAAAQNGFSSPVNVSFSGLPAGVTAQPSTLILAPGTPASVSFTAAAGSPSTAATAAMTGTSGGGTQTANLSINVALAPDFSLSLTPQTLNLNQAQTGQTFQVTAAPLNGFTGNVSVALSNLPTGVTASPANLILTPGIAQPVTLTASATATLGVGSATVTALSGSLSHAGSVPLTVYMAGILVNKPFVHPGISHSQADLDRMKTNVAAGVEPYKSAYAYFSSMGYSHYTNTGQGPFTYETYGHGQFEIRNDAQVAHQNAVMWYITGDTRYRDNAIAIMMVWANTLTSFDTTDYLTAGTCIFDFANAGEILRATAGSAWAPAQITQFQNWMLTVIYPALLDGATIPPLPTSPTATGAVGLQAAGAGGLQMSGLFSLGVFTDRADIYNFAVATWQFHQHYSIGLLEYIDVSGQNYETQRDVGHASGNVGTFAQNAYVVWNQGQDLFFMGNNLLAKAFESQAKFDLGWDVAPIPFTAADGGFHVKMSGDNRTPYDNLQSDLAYYIFHTIKGLNMPYTKMSADYKFPNGNSAGGSLYYLVDNSGNVKVAPLVGAPAPTGVMLYEDELSGSYLTNFQPGVYNNAQLRAGGMQIYGSGAVTSMKVPIGWTVVAYAYDNQTGPSITFTGTVGNQGIADMIALNFNDLLYSMTVTAGTQPYPIFDGTYELINQNSGKAADVATVNPGATLAQSTNTAAETQLWRVQGQGHGQFLIQNMNSNLAMEVSATSSGAGASLDQQTFVPEPDLATGGTASASADAAFAGAGAAQAFDQDITTKWYDPIVGGTATLQYKVPTATVVDTYTLVSGNDVPQRDPYNWLFQGSNDGTHWTTLDTQTAQTFANRQQAVAYPLTNTTPYTYYRLNVLTNQGGSAYGVQLSEMFLYSSLSGATNQRWAIAPLPGSALGAEFSILDIGNGQSMDISGDLLGDGTPIIQNTVNYGNSQRWALQIPSLLLP